MEKEKDLVVAQDKTLGKTLEAVKEEIRKYLHKNSQKISWKKDKDQDLVINKGKILLKINRGAKRINSLLLLKHN